MIAIWSLPGPAALITSIVDQLTDGRQCVLFGSPPAGLRRAVEDALSLRQARLRVIYDDPELSADGVLRREGAGPEPQSLLPAGIWWVDGVSAQRAPGWVAVIGAMAERLRQRAGPVSQRPLLALPLPIDTQPVAGLDVFACQAEPVGRLDLEVAARFAAMASGGCLLGRLRMELAVEMASTRLPQAAALEFLEYWLGAPDEALCDPRHFADFARAGGEEVALPELELWRVQHGVLLVEVERQRLEIVRAYRSRWRVPHVIDEFEGRPAKLVATAELLELKDLCLQLRSAGEPKRSPLFERLLALRDLRNALSHLQPATLAEVKTLQRRAST